MNVEEIKNMNVEEIPLESLQDNPYSLRKKYEDIESLAKSIEERDLQNPISVIKTNNYHVIVHGHRRTRAYRFLNRKTIPGIIRKESTSIDLMLDLAAENLQRKDLSPIEKGNTLEQLFNTIPSVQNNIISATTLINQLRNDKLMRRKKKISNGYNEKDIIQAKKFLNIIGMSPNTAIVYIRLLSLPENIQQNVVSANNANAIPEGKMGVKSAYELTRINDPEVQQQLSEKVTKDKATHVQVKHIVDKLIEGDDTLIRKGATSSAERRTDDDVGAAKLTEDLFLLSAKVDSFRSKLPLVCGRLEKVEWTASLKKMKKTCMDMVRNINNLLHDDIKIEELIEYANIDLEVNIISDLRYRLPNNVIETLGAKEGDVLLLKIEGIKKPRVSERKLLETE